MAASHPLRFLQQSAPPKSNPTRPGNTCSGREWLVLFSILCRSKSPVRAQGWRLRRLLFLPVLFLAAAAAHAQAPAPPAEPTPSETAPLQGASPLPAQSAPGATAPTQATLPPPTSSPAGRSSATATPPPGGAARATIGTKPHEPAAPALSNVPIGNDVILDNADHVFLDENADTVTATGNVRVRYRGYVLSSDKATIDLHTNEATFTGHIALTTPDKGTRAIGITPSSEVSMNLKTGSYRITGGVYGEISPSQLPASGLILPLRLYSGDISGDANVIDARDAQVTTCDFPFPHYAFAARTMTIVVNKHLIARHVSLYRKGHRVITIPAIWLPISNRYAHQNLTPQVGYSQEEGYFAKFADPYVLTAAALGILRLDFMQYKGIGTGFDQSYSLHNNPRSNQGGTVQIYHLYDQSLHEDSLTGTWTHNQSLFDGFNLALNSQFQQNSYYLSTGKSQSLSSQLSLIRNTRDANTNISANWQDSDFGTGLDSNLNASWAQHEVLSRFSHVDFKFAFADFNTASSFGGGSSNQSLTSTLDYLTNPKGYSLEFLIDKFNSLGSTGGASTSSLEGVQRLPEVKVQTDPAGAGKSLFDQLLPRLSRLMLDLGEFSEGISGMHTNRMEFGFDLGNHSDKRRALITTYTGSFQQYFYGDNTAQYILNGQGGYQYNYQKNSSFSVKYSYLRPYGYTPFFFDRSGFYNNLAGTFNFNPSRVFQLSMGTGYDFTRDKSEFGVPAAPWENLLTQITYRPTHEFATQLQGTYDPNTGQFFDVTDTIQARSSSGLAFNSSARYVPQNHEFSEIDSSLDLPIIVDKNEDAGYRIQALEGYNGFTNQFTYKGVALTRSWHDWELSAIYEDIPSGINPGQTFYLNFRLKAFPGYQPFGVGEFGQGLGSGIGQIL